MNSTDERPNVIPWPPLLYAAAIALSVLLYYLWPTPWFIAPLDGMLMVIGILLMLGALAIDFSAMRAMKAANTTIMPTKGSDHLVTSGAFSLSRNPIYLANTMLTIGAGLTFGIAWFILLAFIAAWLTQKLAIKREETHLEHRFGKAFRDYRKRVRRWV